ncbi:hypothetical protein MAPG_00911 [Magnaporthiopsis poae ATCC 64411]|uniref:Uncharacterized protein n=1 Tax=Magnaporthiopsis poae (strain ATCC 64411 / 73-15) TaxID=644358 RepID=A0A0C4DMA7_MAGP6|nr:hypothetical protein MAPG_00911 [Magnaporthiopsis poae ATCC 64411]
MLNPTNDVGCRRRKERESSHWICQVSFPRHLFVSFRADKSQNENKKKKKKKKNRTKMKPLFTPTYEPLPRHWSLLIWGFNGRASSLIRSPSCQPTATCLPSAGKPPDGYLSYRACRGCISCVSRPALFLFWSPQNSLSKRREAFTRRVKWPGGRQIRRIRRGLSLSHFPLAREWNAHNAPTHHSAGLQKKPPPEDAQVAAPFFSFSYIFRPISVPLPSLLSWQITDP